jgi:hypothetical protein
MVPFRSEAQFPNLCINPITDRERFIGIKSNGTHGIAMTCLVEERIDSTPGTAWEEIKVCTRVLIGAIYTSDNVTLPSWM